MLPRRPRKRLRQHAFRQCPNALYKELLLIGQTRSSTMEARSDELYMARQPDNNAYYCMPHQDPDPKYDESTNSILLQTHQLLPESPSIRQVLQHRPVVRKSRLRKRYPQQRLHTPNNHNGQRSRSSLLPLRSSSQLAIQRYIRIPTSPQPP